MSHTWGFGNQRALHERTSKGLSAIQNESMEFNEEIVMCTGCGSGVEHRTLDYKNPGLNPVLLC